MRLIKAFLAAALLFVAGPALAQSGCGGQFGAGQFCGNPGPGTGLPRPVLITPSVFQPIPGGTVIGNPTGASAIPIATTAPVLGIPGTSTGQVGLAGSASGTAILRAQATAGSAVSLLPTAAGTLVGTSAAPLAIDPTTGEISITGLSGGVLAGSGPTFQRTPVLGVPGSAIGTLGFAGNTSGTATITPQATAGSPTLTLPNTSGTFAVGASSPLVLNATTGALTCPTCATTSGGGSLSATTPLTLTGNVLSLNTNGVTYSFLQQIGALSLVGNGTNATANAQSLSGTANQIARVNGAGTAMGFGSIDLSQTASVGTSTLAVANGGTGAQTWTANGPLLGNGTSPFAQGTRAGNTTVFGTVSGTLISGNCLQSDANHNIVDAGAACGGGGGGSGTVTSVGYTAGTGLALSGTASPITTSGSFTYSLAAISADNLLANSTGSSAAPIATPIGSCSGATSALTYNTSTHAFGCNTISPGTGTVTSVGYAAGTGLALSGTASPITGSGSFTYSLASIAADNLLANSTGSSAAPVATPIGSCSAANSALTYNTSTHAFGCNSTTTGTVTSVSVTAGTGITQSGSPVTTSGAITVNVDKAANSDVWGSTSNKVLTSDTVFGSAANAISPSGCGTATVTLSLTAGINFSCQLITATSFTLANPTLTSAMVGRTGCVLFFQPASGTTVTISYGSFWYASGGSATQSLTQTLGALDMLCYNVITTSAIAFTITNTLSH